LGHPRSVISRVFKWFRRANSPVKPKENARNRLDTQEVGKN
jgi:hypothetical protein